MTCSSLALSARLAADVRTELGESPLWCPRTHRLWWIDARQPALHRLDPVDGVVRTRPLPKLPAALALDASGGLLVAFRSRLARLSSFDAPIEWLDLPGMTLGDERFNDGRVDRLGRLWIGTMDRVFQHPIGAIYRLGGDPGALRTDAGHTISNGIGFSPDDCTMYFAETATRTVYAFDFDLAAGRLGRRRVFAAPAESDGAPDGLCVDCEGSVWVAMFGGGCLHRYDPDGRLAQRIALPVSRPTSCTFGGADLRTLYVTTADFDLDAQALAAQPWAGRLLALQTEVPGQSETAIRLDARIQPAA